MSSQYKLICLSHDPGIEIGPEDWYQPETAIGAVTLRTGPAREHKGCDLAIGRYSYPLIEVACPPHDPATAKRQCHHSNIQWVDAGWLRLLWQARQNDDATEKLVGSAAHCWPTQRLERLAPLLGIEGLLG